MSLRAKLLAAPSTGTLVFAADLVQPFVQPGYSPAPHAPRGNIRNIRVGETDTSLTRGERKRVLRKLMSLKAESGEIKT